LSPTARRFSGGALMSESGGLMAIDDPVGIEIRQANAEIEAESDVPIRLTKLVLSGALAAAMASMPFVSQFLISLLNSSSSRFEKRFLRVAEALNDQQKRIEDKIPDRSEEQ